MDKDYVLKETLRLLGEKYPVGLYEYLYKQRTGLYNQLLDIETRTDLTYLNPNACVDQLKAVLREYWKFHIRAIRSFKPVKDFDISQARQELVEERIRA